MVMGEEASARTKGCSLIFASWTVSASGFRRDHRTDVSCPDPSGYTAASSEVNVLEDSC